MSTDVPAPPWRTPEAVALAGRILASYRQHLGAPLLDAASLSTGRSPAEAAAALFEAPLAILAHGQGTDPLLIYGNRAALALFEPGWVNAPARHMDVRPFSEGCIARGKCQGRRDGSCLPDGHPCQGGHGCPFTLHWAGLLALPSRLTAEAGRQPARAALLAEVAARGYATGYSGVRVSLGGRRFRIEDTTVWNLLDEAGRPVGQAAAIRRWTPL